MYMFETQESRILIIPLILRSKKGESSTQPEHEKFEDLTFWKINTEKRLHKVDKYKDILENAFETSVRPDYEMYDSLKKQTGLDHEMIHNFFKKSRQSLGLENKTSVHISKDSEEFLSLKFNKNYYWNVDKINAFAEILGLSAATVSAWHHAEWSQLPKGM